MTDTELSAEVVASQEHWRDGRRYLNEHRHGLSQWAAKNLYGNHRQVDRSGLLTRPDWVPSAPIPLENVTLSWSDGSPAVEVDGTEPQSAGVRPLQSDGRRYPAYAEALGDLARPRLYEDRPCYRLLDVALQDGRAQLSFGLGTYFDVMNVSEAAAHELAAARRSAAEGSPTLDGLPFRSLISDPCEMGRRSILPAISVLTIRRTATDAAFVLHWRDGAKVAHGGGLFQVMPVGMFQPTGSGVSNLMNDFDLWRCIAREYSEEFLGAPEYQSCDRPLDYASWPFYESLEAGREGGKVAVYWLGVGVDPLSFATDLLVAVVIEDDVFDDLFHASVATNAEGLVVGAGPAEIGAAGVPLTEDRVKQLTEHEPMQAAGAALLALVWEHRGLLMLGS